MPAERLAYHGGDLIAHANVFLLFWGKEWATDLRHQIAAEKITALYQEIGSSGYACAWNEYSLLGNAIGPSTYAGSFNIANEPSSPLSDSAIQQQIIAQVDASHVPPPTDDLVYVVLPPSGVPVDAGGVTGCGGSNFTFCGYHDSFRRTPSSPARFRYIVLPFPCEQNGGTCFFAGANDAGGSLQIVGSHELGEAVTDPDAPPVAAGGWFSDRTGNENADICAGSCDASMAIGNDTVQVNSLWSNLAKACIDSVPCSAPSPQCTDPAPGMCTAGRSLTTGCRFEWLVYPNMSLQPSGLPSATVTCTDGHPFCDFDNAQDGQCTFHVAACLNSSDPRLSCSPASISAIRLTRPQPTSSNPVASANATTMLTALGNISSLPATISGATVSYSPPADIPDACTGYFDVVVPTRTVGSRTVSGKTIIRPVVQTASGRTTRPLTLVCRPAS